jgi:hypothetical protein
MRAAIRSVPARIYRMTTRSPSPDADDPVEVEPGFEVPRFVLEWARSGPEEARAFLDRVPSPVELEGKYVLAFGRGAGDLGLEVLHRGARAVVALEMAGARADLAIARRNRERRRGDSSPIEIRRHRGDPDQLPDGPFDLALATRAFRRYGADPASPHLERSIQGLFECLKAGGLLAIEFGPFWKAPYGGAIDSRLPWAHLIFPEEVIFAEYRRLRAASDAQAFADIGINRITLGRFRRAMSDSGFQPLRVEANVGDGRSIRAARALGRLRVLEEYLAQNLYGVWRRP